MKTSFLRPFPILLIGFLACSAVCQTAESDYQPVGGKPVGSGDVVSTARIADPNELVGINGKIVKMSDLVSLLSSLDSLKGQNLHIPVMQTDGTSLPALPPTTKRFNVFGCGTAGGCTRGGPSWFLSQASISRSSDSLQRPAHSI